MYTLSCVSLQVTKKPAVQTGRFSPYPAIYAAARSAQPPDFTDILRTSYLVSEQSRASSQNAPSQTLRYHTTTLPCVSRGYPKKFLQFCRICPNLFSAPSSCGLLPVPAQEGNGHWHPACSKHAAVGIRILKAGENGLSRQFASRLTMTQIRRNLIVKREERILCAPPLIHPRSPAYTWAALWANIRAPARASVRVFPCPPTSTSREPGSRS